MAVAEAIKALDLADALRQGRALAGPFDLWLAADAEAAAITDGGLPREIVRIEKFRHAMIHGGFVKTKKGGRYLRCPQCRAVLPPGP